MEYVEHERLEDHRRGRGRAGFLATWGIVVAISLGLAWLMAKGVPAP